MNFSKITERAYITTDDLVLYARDQDTTVYILILFNLRSPQIYLL